ncbi:Cobalamin synthase [Geobacillus sp. BCO2]|nr:Cobalamin synthase [Geobacillus sp. BCO2]
MLREYSSCRDAIWALGLAFCIAFASLCIHRHFGANRGGAGCRGCRVGGGGKAWAEKQFGGITGDVLGAFIEGGETVLWGVIWLLHSSAMG